MYSFFSLWLLLWLKWRPSRSAVFGFFQTDSGSKVIILKKCLQNPSQPARTLVHGTTSNITMVHIFMASSINVNLGTNWSSVSVWVVVIASPLKDTARGILYKEGPWDRRSTRLHMCFAVFHFSFFSSAMCYVISGWGKKIIEPI